MEESKQTPYVIQPEVNENELWAHAISLEQTIKNKKSDLLAELEALRSLYFENLPLGENKEAIEEYFNRLEESIYNKDHVEREAFPDDDGNECGESTEGHEGSPRPKPDYKYFSADVFKQQASRSKPQPTPQDVDYTGLFKDEGDDAQDQPKKSKPLESIPEHSN